MNDHVLSLCVCVLSPHRLCMLQWYAAMEIQRVFRGFLGRQARRRALAFKVRRLAAVVICPLPAVPTLTFVCVCLCVAQDKLHLSAVRVQLHWYRRNNQFTAFVLLRCLDLHHQWDMEAEAEVRPTLPACVCSYVAVTHSHALPRRRMLASEQMLRPGCRLDGVASLDVEEQSWSRGVIGTAFACKRGGAVSLCAVTWKPSWLHSESSGVNIVQPSPSNATGASRNPGVCCATSNGARQESARCCTSARYAPESRARATCSWPLR